MTELLDARKIMSKSSEDECVCAKSKPSAGFQNALSSHKRGPSTSPRARSPTSLVISTSRTVVVILATHSAPPPASISSLAIRPCAGGSPARMEASRKATARPMRTARMTTWTGPAGQGERNVTLSSSVCDVQQL